MDIAANQTELTCEDRGNQAETAILVDVVLQDETRATRNSDASATLRSTRGKLIFRLKTA